MPDAPYRAVGRNADVAASDQDTSAIRTAPGYSEHHEVGEEEEEVIGGGRVAGSTIISSEQAATNVTGPETVQAKDKAQTKDRPQTPPALAASFFAHDAFSHTPQSAEMIDRHKTSMLSNSNVPTFDDSLALSSYADYSTVTHEAYTHWRVRLKQPGHILEQSKADICDFVDGPLRRRIRIVLIQIYELLDRTPRIYKLLESKRSLENSTSAQSQLDRKLNTLWAELKTRCSLLIVDKDNIQEEADRPQYIESDSTSGSSVRDSTTTKAFVQSRVGEIMDEIANNCNILWERFETSVRGLVFVDSGRSVVKTMLQSGDSQDSREVLQRVLRELLDAYIVQPDLYKAAIRDIVDSIAGGSSDTARLVVSELKRRHVLPGVMFRTLAAEIHQDGGVDDAVGLIGELFCKGAATWIGKRSNGAIPKYAAAGGTMRAAMYWRYYEMKRLGRQRSAASYVRGVTGLIGYLQLDVGEADYKFLEATSEAAADAHSAAVCAALLIVLAVFATDKTVQDMLNAFVKMSTTAADTEIDKVLVALKTEDIRQAGRLVTDVLAMDFGFPNERLFGLKERIEQSRDDFFSDGAIARRLVDRSIEQVTKTAEQRQQYTESVQLAIQHGMFEANGVDVGPWVGRLVRTASAASANEMGELIKEYVAAVFRSAAITPIPEAFLWQTFSSRRISDAAGKQVPPAQVLGLLYILHYNAQLLTQGSSDTSVATAVGKRATEDAVDSLPTRNSMLGAASRPGSAGLGHQHLGGVKGVLRRGEYSDQLVDSVPVSWILQRVRQSTQYQRVWPELVAMATAQHPDQLEVESELQREGADDKECGGDLGREMGLDGLNDLKRLVSTSCLDSLSCLASSSHLGSLGSQAALRLQQAIEAHARLPAAARMATCGQFAERLCRAGVAGADSVEVTAAVRRGWLAVHALDAHAVAAATANAWRGCGRARMTAQDLWLDPLVLLRSDARVLQSAALTDVLLTALAAALAQSHAALRRVFAQRRDGGALRGAHVQALAQLQEAAAVQLAIEATAHAPGGVRRLLFAFVHARFLAQRGVQKLVHFQAYDAAAITAMVRHVPSMHACAEFVPELLMQAPPPLQPFAARLAAAVVVQYPVPANEAMAREVVLPHAQTTLLHAVQPAVWTAMLDAVVAVSTAFPSARIDCRRLVAAACDSVRARPASNTRLVSSCDAALASLGGAPEISGQLPSSSSQQQQQQSSSSTQHQPRSAAAPKRPHSAVAEHTPRHPPGPLPLAYHDDNADSTTLPGLSPHPPRTSPHAVGPLPTPPAILPVPAAFFKKRPRHRSRAPPRDTSGRLPSTGPRRSKSTSAERP
ncbi:Integrator complex subunit 2 [Coemansia sp. RSA 1365]|nr:Integrator complex subunit 2 [Coemansia sp. RSA 1365]